MLRRVVWAGPVRIVLAVVVLAGCGSDAQGGSAESSGTSTSTGTAGPTSQDEVRPDVSAEDCDDPDAALTQAEWIEFCADTAVSAAPEDPAESDVQLSPRGNVVVNIGEEVGIAAEGDTTTGTVAVDAITAEAECTGDPVVRQAPENGHFVRLDVRATTAPVDVPGQTREIAFGENTLRFIGPDGVTFNGALATYAAFTCLADAEQLPDYLGPGQQFSGAVMVDVPATSGTLIHTDPATGLGWEWSF